MKNLKTIILALLFSVMTMTHAIESTLNHKMTAQSVCDIVDESDLYYDWDVNRYANEILDFYVKKLKEKGLHYSKRKIKRYMDCIK